MNNNQILIIKKTIEYVKGSQQGESTGHDWWHTERVWKLARNIAKTEKADIFIVELAALLHDIADFKFNNGDEKAGSRVSREWLEKIGVNEEDVDHICYIVENVSFKGANVKSKINSIEGMIVQDADRLDALGAIGIARTFAYGGSKGREIHNPNYKAELHDDFEKYKSSQNSSIGHFYEKLLLLKDKMNTTTGKEMALDRHKFIEQFLEEFFDEWEGKK